MAEVNTEYLHISLNEQEAESLRQVLAGLSEVPVALQELVEAL